MPIPLSVPNLGPREAELVADCIATGWISSAGRYVGEFEERVRSRVSAAGAVAVSSGTTAIHLALDLAGVRPGDEVVMPSLTFIAPANAVRHHGAWPVFVDIDPVTWQIDPESLSDFLTQGCVREDGVLTNKVTGRPVRGVIPVHVLGHPAPMSRIEQIAAEWGLFVVQDAAEALGAAFDTGVPVGGEGRLVCFSFNGNKIVSTGGGGMIVSDDPELAERARFLSTQAKDDPIEYVHSEVGYNYRLTNVQAAIGVAQMERLDEFVASKLLTLQRYRDGLAGIEGLDFLEPAPGVGYTAWLPTVLLPSRVDRRSIGAALRDVGTEVRPLWQPLHLSRAMKGAHSTPCPVATEVQSRSLSLPSSTNIRVEEIDEVVSSLRDVLGGEQG